MYKISCLLLISDDSYKVKSRYNGVLTTRMGGRTYLIVGIFAAGINYYPIPQIAIKAEYNYRNLKKGYNDEPAINIGIAYEGFFL